jgi:hypothetical protein
MTHTSRFANASVHAVTVYNAYKRHSTSLYKTVVSVDMLQ